MLLEPVADRFVKVSYSHWQAALADHESSQFLRNSENLAKFETAESETSHVFLGGVLPAQQTKRRQ